MVMLEKIKQKVVLNPSLQMLISSQQFFLQQVQQLRIIVHGNVMNPGATKSGLS